MKVELQKIITKNVGICGGVIVCITASTAFLSPDQTSAASLSLDQYLGEVQSGNDGIKASLKTGDAAPDKIADAEMVYAPNVFANIQMSRDKKVLVPQSQRGSETDYNSAQFGMSKMTEFGTAGKLYYTASRTKLYDILPLYVPEDDWRDNAATIEVSQPLWKNFGGKELKKSIELQSIQAGVTQLSESLKRKFSLAEAESNYWRLVLARESVRIAKENLDRAKKIIEWNRRLVNNELADSADLIQAEALGEVRDVELTMAYEENRSAAHAFNTARGVDSGEVNEDLQKITADLIAKIPTPKKSGDREDLKVAIQSERLSELSGDLAGTKYDPTLELFASGAWNGHDTDSYLTANNNLMTGKYPTMAVGLKFNAPIGGDSISRLRGGYAKDREAAALMINRKRYENDREWTDLERKLDESKSRLSLTQKIESTQRRKLEAERQRQSRGRSTMFQVMQMESDFASAQLNVIKNKAEILGIISRMKTFGGEG